MPSIAIAGAQVIDSISAKPITDSVVLIEGKRIKDVGRIPVPTDAEIIYASGMTVMPGLIECHNHPLGERDFTEPGFKKYYDNIVHSPALGLLKGVQVIQGLLTRGVTTVRIPHPTIPNAPELRGEWLVALRQAVERGYFPAPRVVAGGCVLPTGGHLNSLTPPFVLSSGWRGADGPWEVRKQTRECLQHEVDFIKLIGPGHHRYKPGPGPEHTCMTREEISAAVEEAHWRNVPVAAHVKNGPGLRFAVESGVDSIEHGTHLYEQSELMTHMAENGQYLVPTYGMFFLEPLMEAYDTAVPGTRSAYLEMQPELTRNLKLCKAAGVKIAAGTDNTHWGTTGLAWEIESYVREGVMTEIEAIKSATKTGAELCRVEAGTLEPGKFADLLIINGDPLKKISVLGDPGNIEAVIKEGRIVARKGILSFS